MRKITKAWSWIRQERLALWVEYSVLVLAIMLPLLLSGYVLTLDLVFTPNFSWPTELASTYPLEALLWLLHLVLPGDIIEKLVLFAILLLSGVGMHQVIIRLKPSSGISVEAWRISAYFAGIFYMINPFTYSRFMAGQWQVLAGYALLPFFFMALLKLLAAPGRRTALRLALWMFAIVTVSLHHVGMIVILGLVVLCSGIIKPKAAGMRAERVTWTGLSVLGFIVLSSFWLLPALTGKGGLSQATADFNQADFTAFAATAHGSLGLLGDVVRLQGFWAEARQLYLLPQALVPLWGLLFLALWALIISGAVKAWRTRRAVVVIAAGSIVIGVILAITPLMVWLSHLLPVLGGYREPHKFVNLVVFGYALLAAFGTGYLVTWAQRRFQEKGQVMAALCLMLPIITTPVMLWGGAGQLSPRTYPPEWAAMNIRLKEAPHGDHGEVLFLPWHQYMKFGFSGRIIANPAEKFFEVPMVASDDPEFKGVSPTVPDKRKQAVTEALERPAGLSRALKQQGIIRILVAKEDDFEKYGFLDHSAGIEKVYEDGAFKLYELKENKP